MVVGEDHRSSIDPSYLQAAIRWPMHWMVAREFCEHWMFAGFLKSCEVIPTRRGGVDTAAIKSAIRLAKEGGVIGMFPEGRINMTKDLMLPVRPGAALIALKAGVPLVPCYIHGSPYRATALSPLGTYDRAINLLLCFVFQLSRPMIFARKIIEEHKILSLF